MQKRFANIPNLLSLSRVPLGAIIICFYSSERLIIFGTAVAAIALALATDVADGYLARRLGIESATGYLLDGLGDRAIYIALILAFHAAGDIWGILAWLLVLREVAIYAVRVIQVEWSIRLHETRFFSLAHAFFFRVWVALRLLADGLRVLDIRDLSQNVPTRLASLVLIVGALIFGYVSIYATLATPSRAPE